MTRMNWWEILPCSFETIREHEEPSIFFMGNYHMISKMSHLPYSWGSPKSPIPEGKCYSLHCDDFFNKDGLFDFEEWQKDQDAFKPWFVCESFHGRSLHQCGFSMFSDVLADGLELWLNGVEPSKVG